MRVVSSLSWQIIRKVVVVHGIVAIVLTSIQLFSDYNKNLDSIKRNLTSSYEMFGPSMCEAFYNVNRKMMDEIFRGVLSQGDFLGVALYDGLAKEFITRGTIDIDEKTLLSYLNEEHLFFNPQNKPDIIGYQHSMKVEGAFGKEEYFGNLIVFSSKKLAFDRMESTILVVFLNSLVKAVVLVFMFLIVFNRLLIEPLTRINSVISNLSSKNLKSLRLDLDISKSNELYILQSGFNKLLDELYLAQENERILQHQNKFIAIGETIGNIAHQWRQPLATVNMIVSVILDKQQQKTLDSKYLKQNLNEIEKLNIYMSETIESFLSFFSPDKLIQPFSIKEAVYDSIKILKSKIEENGVDVILNISDDISIKSNKQELMQVLIVLLSNGIDSLLESNRNDSRKIEVEVNYDDKVIICIKDYGKGISEDILERIFEPYFTTKYKEKGVGLGLYIAKMIVEKSLEGTIVAKNHEKGAMFTIMLPQDV